MIITSFKMDDFECLYQLCAENSLYYHHLNETLSKEYLHRQLIALPPNALPENKHNLLFWEKNQLLAFLEMIYYYPDKDSVLIVFLSLIRQYKIKVLELILSKISLSS